MCPFTRLCQASYLLGKVERHHLHPTIPETQQFLDASALYVKISALTRQITQEAETSADYLSHSAPLAICFSALCNLCDPYACHRPTAAQGSEDAAMQIQAVEGLKTVASSIKEFAEQITVRTPHSLDIDRISPFIVDSFYNAAANYAWLVRESGDESYQNCLESIRHCLRRLGGRWRCAAVRIQSLPLRHLSSHTHRFTGSWPTIRSPGIHLCHGWRRWYKYRKPSHQLDQRMGFFWPCRHLHCKII